MEITLLAEHLKKEINLYKEFIAVLQKETENIVERDYKGLYETAGLKEGLIIRIERAAGARGVLMHEAAQTLGVEGELKLSSMVERLSGGIQEDIIKSQSTILSLIESIKEINKLNSLVIRESLDNINKTLGFLGNFMPATVYNPTGAFDGSYPSKGARVNEGA